MAIAFAPPNGIGVGIGNWKWKVIWEDIAHQDDEIEDNLRSFADAWALSQPDDGGAFKWFHASRAAILNKFMDMDGPGSVVVVEGYDRAGNDEVDPITTIYIERY